MNNTDLDKKILLERIDIVQKSLGKLEELKNLQLNNDYIFW